MNKIWQYSVPTQDIVSSKNPEYMPVSSRASSIQDEIWDFPDEIPDEMQPETEAESEKCNLSRRKKMAIASSRGRNFNINSKNRYLDRILVPRSNFGGDICNQYPGASNFGSENRFGYSESMKRRLQGKQATTYEETFKRYPARNNYGGEMMSNQYPGASNLGSGNRSHCLRRLQGKQAKANNETFKRYRGFDEVNYVPDTTECRYDLCKYVSKFSKNI